MAATGFSLKGCMEKARKAVHYAQNLLTEKRFLKRFLPLRNKQQCIAILALVVLAFTVLLLRPGLRGSVVVKVDGVPLGITTDRRAVDKIISSIAEEEGMRLGADVRLASQISFERPQADKSLKVLSSDELIAALKDSVKFSARGYVIAVNGKDVVALASEEEARQVISDLRASYIGAIAGEDGSIIEEVLIKERIDIQEKDAYTSIFRSRPEAVSILMRGTDKVLTYVVQRGDSLWDIAQANHLTVDDLLKANPGIDADFIREGQRLNLVVADPYVTLESRETVVYKVSIPYTVEVSYDDSMWPWQEEVLQEGESGVKEVTQQIIRENGKEISRVTVSEKILSYPVTRKVVRGSKQVPPMGSGEMAWPVRGEISSYFGWRWGAFHQGVDIAAPAGTPVIAADSGMVSFAGWSGGYGYLVKVDHGGGKETWYAHLSRINVDVGQTVQKGEVIGLVGSTGNSTGPHLHFEVRINGRAVDPFSYYK